MKRTIVNFGPNSKLWFIGTRLASRNGEYAYYSPKAGKCLFLNALGAHTLDLFEPGSKVEDIIDILASVSLTNKEQIANNIFDFSARMIEKGMLSTSPSEVTQTDTKRAAEDSRIKTIYIHLTDRCTNDCIYCYNAAHRKICRETGNEELSYKEIVHLMTCSKELGATSVVFTGGEPLLRPDLVEVGKKANEIGLKTLLISNGVLISPDNAPKIASVFDSINISLDSWVKQEHEYQRGSGTFNPTIRGIRLLVDQGYDNVVVRVVLTRRTLNSFPEFPKFGKEKLGCTRFFVDSYLPNSFQELSDLDLFPDIDPIYSKVYEEFSSRLRDIDGEELHSDLGLMAMQKCGAGLRIFSIDAIGNVYPCQAQHYPNLAIGNIRLENFSSLVKKSQAKNFLNPFNPREIHECRICKLMPLCGGGCRAIAFALYGDMLAYNEFICPYIKEDIENHIWRSKREVYG